MARFRLKNPGVDAVRFEGKDDACRICNWLAQRNATLTGWGFHDSDITVPTPAGPARATPTHWIVCDEGKFWVYSNDDFIAKYEAISI